MKNKIHEGWLKTSLENVINLKRGYDLPHNDRKKGEYYVVASNSISGTHNQYKTKGPGVVTGRSGTIGAVQYIENDFWPLNTTLYVNDFKDNDKRFIYYFLKTLKLENYKSGSGVPTLNRNHVLNIVVNIPPIETQKKIGNLLYSLEEKIELNNKINKELEEMAKTIYDYWFVQFDFPDDNGKPYKSSGGEMVWSEELKREIPVGWEVKKINDILEVVETKKKIKTKDIATQGVIPVVDQSTDFIAGYTNDIEGIINADIPKIIFGDHTRIIKFINFNFARGADGTQILVSSNSRMPQHLFYHSLLKIDLSNYGYARHFKFLKENMIILPNESLAKLYEKKVLSYFEFIKKNLFENRELESLRDWLLPMLMNGQVKIK